MIERLPLELFDDIDDSSTTAIAGEEVMIDEDQQIDIPLELDATSNPVIVDCQWCGVQFDNELSACPDCGAKHIRVVTARSEEPATVTCQWCLTEFDAGPTACPSCGARALVPGQYVPGEDEPYISMTSRAIRARQAQSRQMLAGMMAGGGIEGFVAGLISIAISIIDDE